MWAERRISEREPWSYIQKQLGFEGMGLIRQDLTVGLCVSTLAHFLHDNSGPASKMYSVQYTASSAHTAHLNEFLMYFRPRVYEASFKV
jgi:hypothetical protein